MQDFVWKWWSITVLEVLGMNQKPLSLVKKNKKGSIKKGQRLQPLSVSSDRFNTTVSAQEIEQFSKDAFQPTLPQVQLGQCVFFKCG